MATSMSAAASICRQSAPAARPAPRQGRRCAVAAHREGSWREACAAVVVSGALLGAQPALAAELQGAGLEEIREATELPQNEVPSLGSAIEAKGSSATLEGAAPPVQGTLGKLFEQSFNPIDAVKSQGGSRQPVNKAPSDPTTEGIVDPLKTSLSDPPDTFSDSMGIRQESGPDTGKPKAASKPGSFTDSIIKKALTPNSPSVQNARPVG